MVYVENYTLIIITKNVFLMFKNDQKLRQPL
jgi:hypothetical protein